MARFRAQKPQVQPASTHPTWTGIRSVQSTSRARGLTPERLGSFLRQAEDGDPRAQCELAMEMEDRDLHLVSVLQTRRRAVAGLPWRVTPASPRRVDRRIAEDVTAMLQRIGAPRGLSTPGAQSGGGLRAALVELLDAVTKSYSFVEIDWRQEPGRVSVAGLVWRPPTWFTPAQDRPDQWRLVSDRAPIAGEELQPGSWIMHRSKAKSGLTLAGSALIRPLAWAYLFKNYALKDWVIFMEAFGAPMRLAKYQPGTSPEDRAELLSQLVRLGVSSAAIFPADVEVQLVEAARTSSVDIYDRLISWVDKAYSKAVLGQTLTTEEGKSGSLALGRVHADVRQDLLEADAMELSDTITRDLVASYVALQHGDVDPPRFELDTTPPEDKTEAAKLYVELDKLGVQFPRAHVHERFGVPMPAEGEPTYGRAPAQAPTASSSVAASGSGTSDMEVALAELPPMPAEMEKAIREALDRGGFRGWEDVTEHLRRYLEMAQRPEDVHRMLVQACEKLDLQPQVQHLADELIRADLIGRAQVQAGEQPVGEWPAVPPRAAIEFWTEKTAVLPQEFASLSEVHRSRAFTVARFSTLQAVQAVSDVAAQAVREGWSQAEFEDAYEARLSAMGMTPASPHHTELVYRNNLQTAHQVGRYRHQMRPESLARRPFLMYDAVDQDERSRESHLAMDGRCYAADDPTIQVWYPPNGHGCRCRMRALTSSELVEMGLTVEESAPRWTRRLPDGRVVTEPLLPDEGWRTNPALEPHQFDFSGFDPEFKRALGVEE